jgi:hypothetical protein
MKAEIKTARAILETAACEGDDQRVAREKARLDDLIAEVHRASREVSRSSAAPLRHGPIGLGQGGAAQRTQ